MSRSSLDIIVFVAHLELSRSELDGLVSRMLGELNWPAISARICLVVPDNSEFEANPNQAIVVLRSAAAAAMFRERSRVLEALPHDFLISFGLYLPTTDTVAQLRIAAQNEELISAVAPRIAIGSLGELMTLGSHRAPNASGRIEPRYASKLPAAYYIPEMLCPCMLLSGRMI